MLYLSPLKGKKLADKQTEQTDTSYLLLFGSNYSLERFYSKISDNAYHS